MPQRERRVAPIRFGVEWNDPIEGEATEARFPRSAGQVRRQRLFFALVGPRRLLFVYHLQLLRVRNSRQYLSDFGNRTKLGRRKIRIIVP
jgi:hypothetical protein